MIEQIKAGGEVVISPVEILGLHNGIRLRELTLFRADACSCWSAASRTRTVRVSTMLIKCG